LVLENSHEPVHKPEVGHEERDTNIRAILWFALSLALTIIVVMVLMKFLFGVLPSPGPATSSMSSVQASELPPEPRLQVNAPEDLRKMRAQEDSTLESYGWINKQDGIVRIPIDRAMDLLGQRGLPPLPQPPAKPRVK
jgi:hypothetical protein